MRKLGTKTGLNIRCCVLVEKHFYKYYDSGHCPSSCGSVVIKLNKLHLPFAFVYIPNTETDFFVTLSLIVVFPPQQRYA
jgi:hypothetical protein